MTTVKRRYLNTANERKKKKNIKKEKRKGGKEKYRCT